MSIEWLIIRGSGLVAFGLLWAATAWGLLLSTNLVRPIVKAKPLTFAHESLGLGALLATIVHLVALGVDDYVEFGPAELFVPGMSEWRPVAVALGVMAFYGLAVVSLSFYFKKWIGNATWRTIHFGAFGSYLAALIHGLTAGTDTAHPTVLAMYIMSGVTVASLVAVRLLGASSPAGARSPTRQRSAA